MKMLSIERVACSVAMLFSSGLVGCKPPGAEPIINQISLRQFVPDNILVAADLIGVPIVDQPVEYGSQEFVSKICDPKGLGGAVRQVKGCVPNGENRIIIEESVSPLTAVHEAFHLLLMGREGVWKVDNEAMLVEVRDGKMWLRGSNIDGADASVEINNFHEWWVRVTDYTLAAKILTDQGEDFDLEKWEKKKFEYGLGNGAVSKDWANLVELTDIDKDIMSQENILITLQIAFDLAQTNSVIGEGSGFFGPIDETPVNVDVKILYLQLRNEVAKTVPEVGGLNTQMFMEYVKKLTTMNGY